MDAIRFYIQKHYTDEMLAATLAHAQDGKLSYTSCCCFIGIPTANHKLSSVVEDDSEHYRRAHGLQGAEAAEKEFYKLARGASDADADARRRERLIPILLEEMARREALRTDSDLLMCELEAVARG